MSLWPRTITLRRENSASYLKILEGKTLLTMVTLYVFFYALTGQNLTGEFIRKIYAAT